MMVAVAMAALFAVSCNQSEKADDGAMPQIRVGVFNGNGGTSARRTSVGFRNLCVGAAVLWEFVPVPTFFQIHPNIRVWR